MKSFHIYFTVFLLILILFSCSKEENTVTPLFEIGELAHGGMVFYVDETGQHGLVSALEDITYGATDTTYDGDLGYEWGCYEKYVPGADNENIGSGYQNTIDILTHMCESENGGKIAAQVAYDYESEAYTDWYLPSRNELEELYFSIGFGGQAGNIGNFLLDAYYWSSTEVDPNNAYNFLHKKAFAYYFYDANNWYSSKAKDQIYRVRPIRSF